MPFLHHFLTWSFEKVQQWNKLRGSNIWSSFVFRHFAPFLSFLFFFLFWRISFYMTIDDSRENKTCKRRLLRRERTFWKSSNRNKFFPFVIRRFYRNLIVNYVWEPFSITKKISERMAVDYGKLREINRENTVLALRKRSSTENIKSIPLISCFLNAFLFRWKRSQCSSRRFLAWASWYVVPYVVLLTQRLCSII